LWADLRLAEQTADVEGVLGAETECEFDVSLAKERVDK
jgi:hypothetical protein